MSVNDEIEQLVDTLVGKFSNTLKEKLMKIVIKNEKTVLRQYVASQKESSRTTRVKTEPTKQLASTTKKKRTVKKKLDYSSLSESDYSDSD
jgi:hypothetical protein